MILELANPNEGELRVGCPRLKCGIFPSIVERFKIKCPGARLQVIHANTSMLHFHELRSRQVDLLIGRARPAILEDDLAYVNLFKDLMLSLPDKAVCGSVVVLSNSPN